MTPQPPVPDPLLDTDFTSLDVDGMRQRIRKLNTRAGQMKMDLHDLAEGLPADFEQLPELAASTYRVFAELEAMRRHLKSVEKSLQHSSGP